jgi:uncharacterized protein YecA (UPF0149 family)
MGILDRIRNAFSNRQTEGGPVIKPGRNEPCWCGSGKKYKKCHLPREERKAADRACALNCGPT